MISQEQNKKPQENIQSQEDKPKTTIPQAFKIDRDGFISQFIIGGGSRKLYIQDFCAKINFQTTWSLMAHYYHIQDFLTAVFAVYGVGHLAKIGKKGQQNLRKTYQKYYYYSLDLRQNQQQWVNALSKHKKDLLNQATKFFSTVNHYNAMNFMFINLCIIKAIDVIEQEEQKKNKIQVQRNKNNPKQQKSCPKCQQGWAQISKTSGIKGTDYYKVCIQCAKKVNQKFIFIKSYMTWKAYPNKFTNITKWQDIKIKNQYCLQSQRQKIVQLINKMCQYKSPNRGYFAAYSLFHSFVGLHMTLTPNIGSSQINGPQFQPLIIRKTAKGFYTMIWQACYSTKPHFKQRSAIVIRCCWSQKTGRWASPTLIFENNKKKKDAKQITRPQMWELCQQWQPFIQVMFGFIRVPGLQVSQDVRLQEQEQSQDQDFLVGLK